MVKYTRKKKRTSRKKNERIYIGGNGHERCVIVTFIDSEGLGNQLFIYAAGLVVAKKTGLPLCIYNKKTNPHSKLDYRNIMKATPVEEANIKERRNSAHKVLEHIAPVVGKWSNANIKTNSNTTKNIKLPDYLYQNYSSVHSAIPEVKNALTEKEFNKDHYKKFKIDSEHSAFMHVRRGDYVGMDWALNIDYYCEALKKLNDKNEIETVYVLSNDSKWCKNHQSVWEEHAPKKKIVFYDEVNGHKLNELDTLYVMMSCTAGAIISNSTFSAWGAMLGADMNVNSVITYPAPWLKNNGPGDNELSFPERWVQIRNTKLK